MATKAEARHRKVAWQAALEQGRVVNINHGQTLTSFPTRERAEEAVRIYATQGVHSHIVHWGLLMPRIEHKIPSPPSSGLTS